MRHGCSIRTATISRSFIKANLISIVPSSSGPRERVLSRARESRPRGQAMACGYGWLALTGKTPDCS
jgi:hypothetical protein